MQRIGITFSCFDLLHAGHSLMLYEAKQHCDFLIVGLQSDPSIDRRTKRQPIQTMFERWVQLETSKYVDKIIPYSHESDIPNIIGTNNIAVRIIGEEYRDADYSGKGCLNMHGRPIEMVFNTRRHSFSTTELRERIKDRR